MNSQSTRPGAAPYSKLFLAIYDLWVIRLSNDYGWRCNRKHFVDLYRERIGRRHLEVGPGSGWVLANIDLPTNIDLTLVDLNANSLEHTDSRLDVSPTLIEHDVMRPLPENVDTFDSVSINYVLHCLPGDWSTKSVALTNLANVLRPEGVLFGSTVIGVDQKYTALGAALMFAYNRIGAFGNRHDDLPGLRQVLSDRFEQVEVTMVGNVALFVARHPIEARQRTD
ncbi:MULTISPECIES: class I SAM-dependent methyltransferase [unclassified Rhodococcus (in: high G+C Gram-positive bacteria)]|uniref:class I SAM-dependent methyltransferase n=1 Tax=unclassified Rhodococcus (in: high G+C Gram-positive bacteria) TaxID=192944 RepID=UPI002953DC68|nr:methyltransferase domain-containing protein [Rhodococcus sp. IEGM 1343]MDV8057028.1 methyltransferase domain-containing protein [Rhodococcus sp. IEGM 1343]